MDPQGRPLPAPAPTPQGVFNAPPPGAVVDPFGGMFGGLPGAAAGALGNAAAGGLIGALPGAGPIASAIGAGQGLAGLAGSLGGLIPQTPAAPQGQAPAQGATQAPAPPALPSPAEGVPVPGSAAPGRPQRQVVPAKTTSRWVSADGSKVLGQDNAPTAADIAKYGYRERRVFTYTDGSQEEWAFIPAGEGQPGEWRFVQALQTTDKALEADWKRQNDAYDAVVKQATANLQTPEQKAYTEAGTAQLGAQTAKARAELDRMQREDAERATPREGGMTGMSNLEAYAAIRQKGLDDFARKQAEITSDMAQRRFSFDEAVAKLNAEHARIGLQIQADQNKLAQRSQDVAVRGQDVGLASDIGKMTISMLPYYSDPGAAANITESLKSLGSLGAYKPQYGPHQGIQLPDPGQVVRDALAGMSRFAGPPPLPLTSPMPLTEAELPRYGPGVVSGAAAGPAFQGGPGPPALPWSSVAGPPPPPPAPGPPFVAPGTPPGVYAQ